MTRRLLLVRETFWFLPALMGVLAVVLAELLLQLDRTLVAQGEGPWFLTSLSATGSRALLTTAGGSMLGVAATSFSITISVLATTSSTYGPRLVRNFMADRGNQMVLAALTSSFVYFVVVLRAVRSEADGSEAFVPVVAVNVAVLVTVVDVAVLVYFIHHIATSVQVTTLQERVAGELDEVIEACYPAEPDPRRVGLGPGTSPGASPGGIAVRARACGYVRDVDLESLLRLATSREVGIEVVAMPGHHLVDGQVLATVDGAGAGSDGLEARVRRSFSVAAARSPQQDVAYAVQQVTELAVRGLATGTNDPYTAISAIDALSGRLVTLVWRPQPAAGLRDDDGEVRVVARWPERQALLLPMFDALREYGSERTAVTLAVLRLGERLLVAAREPGLREVVAGELVKLEEAYARHDPLPADGDLVRAELTRVLESAPS